MWLLPKAGQTGPNVPIWTYNQKLVYFQAPVAFRMENDKNKSKFLMFCCGVKDGAIHQVLDEKCTQKFEIGAPLS